MKKIIFFDPSIATLNIGDEIIMHSIKRNMQDITDDNYCMSMPMHTPTFYIYQNLLCKKLKTFAEADYKFLCGTNMLYTNMLRPLPIWNVNIFNTRIQRDSILLGVGCGINSNKLTKYTKWLYSRTLSKKYYHSTRDEVTKNLLESIGLKAKNTGCPTLWQLTPEHCSNIPVSKAKKVIFTLTHYKNLQNSVLDRAMIDILKDNYEQLFFWPQSINDLDYLYQLGISDSVTIIPPNLKSYERILKTDIDYIGTRLHGGIFALQQKKRALIIAIDYRAREMNKTFSIPCIEREDIERRLHNIINSTIHINITGIDYDKISFWKSQFK